MKIKQSFNSLADYYALNPSELAGTTLFCPICKREHRIPIKLVWSGRDLIQKIPAAIDAVCDQPIAHIGVVYDRHIEEIIESLFFQNFDQLHFTYTRVPLGNPGLLLDSTTELGDQAAAKLPKNIDFLIGVGSGVISDLTKWMAKTTAAFFNYGNCCIDECLYLDHRDNDRKSGEIHPFT